jgi:hypothetical protein
MTFRIRSNAGCDHWNTESCDRCDADMLAEPRTPFIQFFDERTYEHMYDPWETPRPISSREELRVECERRGVYSHDLRDSIVWKSGPTRWV